MTARVLTPTILATALLMVACGRRTTVAAPPVTTPSAESLHAEGVAAFHEGTPEGYTRAADAFRKASKLKGDRCEYSLNLAQALLFLATEQLLNWEEYEPRQTEAASIVNAAEATCLSYYEPFLLRLRALIAGRGPTATELINRAVDLDSADAMNWVVLGYLDPQSRHLVSPDGAGRWIAMGQAAKLLPGSALIQYELGKNYQTARGKESEANPAFKRAIELSSRHFRAYLGLAYSADENVDVEPLYQKVVDIAPDFLEGRLAMGSYYAAIGLRYTGREFMAAEIKRRRFTVDDCYKMVEAGILRHDERVELIRGEIIQMSPIGTRHAAAVDRGNRAFVRLAGDGAIVRIQSTTVLDEFCAPEPDIALLRPREDFYVHKHPAGADIFLIVEIADSSLEYDTSVKVELYSILGVPEYWVADLRNNRLLAYSDPREDAYLTIREFHRGDVLAPQLLPDCQLSIDILLP